MKLPRRFQLARRAPNAPRLQTLFVWDVIRPTLQFWLKMCYRLRLFGQERIPKTGPIIFAANHQSHLDPIVVGIVGSDRPIAELARRSLFDPPVLGFMLRVVGVIPIERGAGDRGAIKTALGVLKDGRTVSLFPEGTRSVDGRLGEFRNGVLLLARRSGAPVVPIAVEGTHGVWPKGRRLPRCRGRIVAQAGDPIPAETLRELGDDAMEHLRRAIETMRLELRAELRRTTRGRYPPPGPADKAYWEE